MNIRQLSLVFLLAVSCTREYVTTSGDGLGFMTFEASSDALKSTYVRGEDAVNWSAEDCISVFDGIGHRKFSTMESGASAIFSGYAAASDRYVLVYPCSDRSEMPAAGRIKAVLKRVQWGLPGRISDGANLSVGISSGFAVTMKNVGGYVCFSFPEDTDIVSVRLAATGGETLSGLLDISYDGVSAPATSASGGDSWVELLSPEGTFRAGEYFMVANPVRMASGFRLTFRDSRGRVAVSSSSAPNTIERNRTLDLGVINTSALTFSDDTGCTYMEIDLPFKKPGYFYDVTTTGQTDWPFVESSSHDTLAFYHLKDVGYEFYLNGNGYRHSKAGYFFNTGFAEGPAYFQAPAVYRHSLVSVNMVYPGSYPVFTATDVEGNLLSYNQLGSKPAESDYCINIAEAPESEPVRLQFASNTRATRLVLRYSTEYPSVPSVTSIAKPVPASKAESSFVCRNGSAADFDFGFEYIPSDSDDWSSAAVLNGTVDSEAGGTVKFSAPLSSFCNLRAWVRPKGTSRVLNQYSIPNLFYGVGDTFTLTLDFYTNKSPLFKPSGSFYAPESATLDDPRTGYPFPTGKQVADQSDGSASNNGGTLYGTRSGTTKYWTNYPQTKFVFTQDGVDYEFVIGTGIILYDGYLYYSDGHVRNNKLLMAYPVIPGYVMKKVHLELAKPSGSTYLYSFGKNTSYTNLGTATMVSYSEPTIEEFEMPGLLPSDRVLMKSDNAIYIRKMVIDYQEVL